MPTQKETEANQQRNFLRQSLEALDAFLVRVARKEIDQQFSRLVMLEEKKDHTKKAEERMRADDEEARRKAEKLAFDLYNQREKERQLRDTKAPVKTDDQDDAFFKALLEYVSHAFQAAVQHTQQMTQQQVKSGQITQQQATATKTFATQAFHPHNSPALLAELHHVTQRVSATAAQKDPAKHHKALVDDLVADTGNSTQLRSIVEKATRPLVDPSFRLQQPREDQENHLELLMRAVFARHAGKELVMRANKDVVHDIIFESAMVGANNFATALMSQMIDMKANAGHHEQPHAIHNKAAFFQLPPAHDSLLGNLISVAALTPFDEIKKGPKPKGYI